MRLFRHIDSYKNILLATKKMRVVFTLLALSVVVSTLVGTVSPNSRVYAEPSPQAACAANDGVYSVVNGKGVCTPNPSVASTFTAEQEVQSLSYFVALSAPGGCIDQHMPRTLQSSAASNGDISPTLWFDGFDGASGYVFPIGKQDCKNIVPLAMNLWGYKTNAAFLNAIGYTYSSTTAKWTQPGGADGKFDSKRMPTFKSNIMSAIYKNPGDVTPVLSAAGYYAMYLSYFTSSSCSAKDLGTYSSLGQNPTIKSLVDGGKTYSYKDPVAGNISGIDIGSVTYVVLNLVNSKSQREPHGYVYQSSTAHSTAGPKSAITTGGDTSAILYGGGNPTTQISLTCSQLAAKINEYTPLYIIWLVDHPTARPLTQVTATCVAGATNCGPPGSTCTIQNVGWIICPMVNFMATTTDGIYGAIKALLVTDVQTLSTDCSKGCGTYSAWGTMRTFANIGFVIVFLIIIFSQLTNIGITNYGVKKLLPRLIIVAILVNVSYFLCQVVVDLSNIAGGSIRTIFDNIPVFSQANSVDDTGNLFTGVATNILSATAASGTIGGLAIVTIYTGPGLLIPILLGAILAVIVTIFILVARNVIIILLVAISPLAFLAILLPNTENLFKQWRKIIVAMLLVYPLIAILFGASKLASDIILASGASDIQRLFGLAALFLPLFITPILMKNSLNAIPALGNFANKLQSRANGLVGKSAKEFYNATPIARGIATRKQKRSDFRDQKFAENLENGGIASLMARGVPGLNKLTKAGQYADKALSRSALGATEKADDDDIKFQKVAISRAASDIQRSGGRAAGIEYARQQLETSIANKDSVGARAAFDYLKSTGQAGVEAASSTIATNRGGDVGTLTSLARHIDVNHGDVKQIDNRLKNWASGDNSALDARVEKDADGNILPGTGVPGKHLEGLTDTEIASQTAESISSGILTPAQATKILNNVALIGILKPGATAALIAHGGIPPKPPTP